MLVCVLAILFAGWNGADARVDNPPPLEVGICEGAPFCMKAPDGHWNGLSVELWESIAAQLQLRYTFKEYALEGLIKAVANGDVAVGVGPISATAEREQILDFTHPYYVSDLAIAVAPHPLFPWTDIAAQFFTRAWLKLLIGLFIMLAVSGVFVWLFERKRNHDQFGGNWHHGLGSGFWWAAVTMAGVGYGDKAPRTFGGRAVALLWMFISVITVALVTASVTSAVVTNSIVYNIHGPRDLGRARVSVVNGSTAERYTLEGRINSSLYPSIEACLDAVLAHEADACIGDESELRYLVKTRYPHRLDVLPFTFQREDCCFIVSPGSPLREQINRVLLEKTQGYEWRLLRSKYLGD